MRKLNILNLATTDSGGAGEASLFLNDLFTRHGHNSILVVNTSRSKNGNDVVVLRNTLRDYIYQLLKRVKSKIVRTLKIKNNYVSKYSFNNTDERTSDCSAKEILGRLPFSPDLIVLHWVSNFVNSEEIRRLREMTGAGVLWIMMDNAPITGGCHYPWDCEGYQTDCQDCPAILKYSDKNRATTNLGLKKRWLPENITLIASSEGDYQRAIKSSLFAGKQIRKFMFPLLNENEYAFVKKRKAKEHYGIDKNCKVILYGALSLEDPRKGFTYFKQSLTYLVQMLKAEGKPIDDYLLLIAGNGDSAGFRSTGLNIRHLGRLTQDELIRAYQAADVYVSSSVEDSGPLMVYQAILTGTPVAAFEIGAALDLVITGVTGYRARLMCSEDLGIGIHAVLGLDDQAHSDMCRNSRELGLKVSHNDINAILTDALDKPYKTRKLDDSFDAKST